MRRRLLVGVLALLAVSLAVGASAAIYKHYRWKRFAVVEPGRLYRSGQLEPWQLERAIEQLGLRTVICLTPERAEEERALCARRGVAFHLFTMPADGHGAADDFRRILALFDQPEAAPVLVHCRAGVARTGVAVALYRIARQGWPVDSAVGELASFEKRGHIEPALRRHLDSVLETLRDER